MKKLIISLVAFVAFAMMPACTAAAGKKAPDFSLTSISGETVSLSDSDGKVRIVDFWATWCPPCRKGIPEFVELYDQYKDQGLEIIGISVDQDGAEVVKPFAKKMKMNYPVLLDDGEVSKAYGGIRAIPTAFVINQQGEIVKKYVGYRPKDVFEADIQNLLKE